MSKKIHMQKMTPQSLDEETSNEDNDDETTAYLKGLLEQARQKQSAPGAAGMDQPTNSDSESASRRARYNQD